MSTRPVSPSLHVDRVGIIRPDLIPLAAFLCAEEYDTISRGIILDHAAAGAPLEILTARTPDDQIILEPADLAGAEEALARGGPAPIAGGAPALAELEQELEDPRPVVSHAPGSLVELVEHEALGYRAWKTPAGDFLARQMERLAELIRFTGATTPEDHEDRITAEEAMLREHWYELGRAHEREQMARDAWELRTFGPMGRPLDPMGHDDRPEAI